MPTRPPFANCRLLVSGGRVANSRGPRVRRTLTYIYVFYDAEKKNFSSLSFYGVSFHIIVAEETVKICNANER